jgi:hypothetical protein
MVQSMDRIFPRPYASRPSLPRSRGRAWAAAALATLSLFVLAAPAVADDSSAQLSTGGLVFVQNPNVQMRSEQLSISTKRVEVTYHFFNTSAQSVTNLVAFPLPDITIDSPDSNISIPSPDAANFLGFAVASDGQKVTTQMEQKAYAKGVDQTALLHQLGIPLAPQLQATDAALDTLPRAKWQQLIDLGLAAIDQYGSGPNPQMVDHLEPRWTLKTNFYWQQTFPPRQDLVIHHEYEPSVGTSLGSGVGNTSYAAPADYKTTYCMDPDFIAAAARDQAAATKANKLFGERRIDFVLKTGANWAGPIADFTAIIDKGAPANLVSFCGTGVKKVGPTQFQVHYTNYTPTSDLAILILTGDLATQ